MKYTFVLSQSGVVAARLIGRINVEHLCLLDYLHGWFFSGHAKREWVEGRKFVWLHYERAVEELPLLFNPRAKIASQKNKLCSKVERLRKVGLVETIKVGRRLFFRLTESGVSLTSPRQRTAQNATTAVPTVTPPADKIVTPCQDGIVTPSHDDARAPNMTETSTKESQIKESPPLSPSEGDAERLVACWNSFSKLPAVNVQTPGRARKLRRRLADTFWRDHWREGIERVASSAFLTGGGPSGWRATLDWFLRADSLANILEGAYDGRPRSLRQESPASLVFQRKTRLETLSKLIEEHPAHPNSNWSGPPTPAEQEEYRTFVNEAAKLQGELALGSGL